MKILVIRFSSIGDIVLTSPVVRCLKRQLGAEVHFLTKASYAQIVMDNPYVDRVYTIRSNINEMLPELRRQQYDVIVDLHKNIRSIGLQLALSRKALSLNKANWRKWLMVKMKVQEEIPHIVDRYLDTVKSLGVQNDGQGLDYFIPENCSLPFILPSRYICFAIGGAHETKKMPVHKWEQLASRMRIKTFVIGGPEDKEAGVGISRQSDQLQNMAGLLSLGQSALMISKADLVVTHDTGMMHIAAAYNRPIISIWGNTVPAFGMTPYKGESKALDAIVQIDELSCRPCSRIGFDKCPKGHFNCMELQNIDTVCKEINRILSGI